MSENLCGECRKNAASLNCGICEKPLCKPCAQVVGPDRIPFFQPLPKHFENGTFCPGCYQSQVQDELEAYDETLAKAESVDVFFKNQGKETRLIKRGEKPIKIENCEDRQETLMKLAYLAASKGFNVLVDVELDSEKVLHGKWQKLKWRGRAIPAKVPEAQINRHNLRRPN
jgi:hypothetical protein